MFIFVLQGVWLYISELAGKDLDITVTAKFILFYMPKLIPLVVPLTVLLASIMVFGNFAENYEFAAMKSTGISLQRSLRSLVFFIVTLGIACFFFANNVIPWGEYNFYNLRRDIAKKKPALAIAEDQFNEIGNINIKVDKKTGDRGQFLEGVIIHKKNTSRAGNFVVILAERGELKSSINSSILKLELYNGNYYEEILSTDREKRNHRPHAQSFFDSYTINVDLEKMNSGEMDDEKLSNRYNMLDVKQLNYYIDSLETKEISEYERFSNTLYKRSTFDNLIKQNTKTTKQDTSSTVKPVLSQLPYSEQTKVLNLALNSANSTLQIIDSNKRNFELKSASLNKHIISLHDKFVLAIACVILFFVGAPLGALIRKGGLGLPMVIAIVLFLTYHFFGIFSKNSAEKGSFSPVVGAWLSTAVMLPLSIYLTHRATNDRDIFQFDALIVPFKRLINPKNKLQLSESETKKYNYYKKYSISELITIIKEQGQFDLDKKPKEIALHNLLQRNISLEELSHHGLDIPAGLIKANTLIKDYADYSKTSLISYCTAGLLLGFHFIFINNKLPELAEVSLYLSLIAYLFFAIYVIVDAYVYTKFYKAIDLDKKRLNPLVLLLSLPVYPFKYIVLRNHVSQDFYYSCLQNIK